MVPVEKFKEPEEPSRFNELDSYWSGRLRSALGEFFDDMRQTWKRTETHDLPILASSLSFFCLFTAFPFLILCFIGTRYVVGMDAVPQREIATFFETFVPNIAPWITESLINIVNRNLVSNLFNLALLLISAYGLFTCLHTIFSRLSPKGKKRDFIGSNFVALVCFTGAALSMTLLILLFTTRAENLRLLFSQYLGGVSVRTIALAAPVIAVSAIMITITLVYKLMPLQPVQWVHAFRGSVLFLALFFVGRVSYQTYIRCYAVFNESTYGNFFTLVVVFVWLYYLCSSFIFSAQYALYLGDRPKRIRRKIAA